MEVENVHVGELCSLMLQTICQCTFSPYSVSSDYNIVLCQCTHVRYIQYNAYNNTVHVTSYTARGTYDKIHIVHALT